MIEILLFPDTTKRLIQASSTLNTRKGLYLLTVSIGFMTQYNSHIEKALECTAHSPILAKKLNDNDPSSAAVKWLETDRISEKLKIERRMLLRVMGDFGGPENGERRGTISILAPIIPAPAGIYTGHHATYKVLKHFIHHLSNLQNSNEQINVRTIFLDQSASSYMKHHPIDPTSVNEELAGYSEKLKEYQYERAIRPDYKEGHEGAAIRLLGVGGQTNVFINYESESELYRKMMHDPGMMEILRQAPRILHQFDDFSPTYAETKDDKAMKDKERRGKVGIDLLNDELCTVVLRAASLMTDDNKLSVIVCGGDLFEPLLNIRSMMLRFFRNSRTPCDKLENLCIITTVKSEAIRISQNSISMNLEEQPNYRKLVEEGAKKENLDMSEDKMRKFIGELEILIGEVEMPDTRIPSSKTIISIHETPVDTFLSGLTKKARWVIKQLFNHHGKREEGGITQQQIRDKVNSEEKGVGGKDAISQRGVNKILENLKNLGIVNYDRVKGRDLITLKGTIIEIDFNELFK